MEEQKTFQQVDSEIYPDFINRMQDLARVISKEVQESEGKKAILMLSTEDTGDGRTLSCNTSVMGNDAKIISALVAFAFSHKEIFTEVISILQNLKDRTIKFSGTGTQFKN